MEFVSSQEQIERQVASNCRVYEYPTNDPSVNGAKIELDGRYPERGWSMNTKCTAMLLVLGGEGTLFVGGTQTVLYPGDRAIIKPNEQYYLRGSELVLDYVATPAWTPDQSKVVED